MSGRGRIPAGHLLHAAGCTFFAAACRGRVPLAVSYVVTNRCNYTCAYCSRWSKTGPELNTDQVVDLLRGLKELGTKFLQITGGEPLLRNDLLHIVREARELGFYTGINTNGSLLKTQLGVLDYVDRISFSMDGPPDIHELIRPRNSWAAVDEAIDLARAREVRVSLTATMTKHNTGCVDFLIRFAERKGVRISFQPAEPYRLSSRQPNATIGEEEDLRAAFAEIERKKKAWPIIENSAWDLHYLKEWPRPQNLECAGGALFWRIESNGDVMICGMREDPEAAFPNVLRDGLAAAILGAARPDCGTCYNPTRLRINLFFSLLRLNRSAWAAFLGS